MDTIKNKTTFKPLETLKHFFNNATSTSYDDIVKYMYYPTDPSSLGIIRFLFGLLMLADMHEERGGADVDLRWGDEQDCHFPLFPVMVVPSFPYVAMLYGIMWIGALGIMLGYKFKLSAIIFAVPYWYILLLDKSFWNNHSYLFGIISILLIGSSANHFFSIDALLDKSINNAYVPYWNYFILKFQFFLLYFLAGLKKTDFEWLEGYSMTDLGQHWVFYPFQIILTPSQIDYLIVHWFGFLLDLTIGFWMLMDFSRPIAMMFCALFHLMNSRLFSIGMFPYVCLATMPLFCDETWPRKIQKLWTKNDINLIPSKTCIYEESESKVDDFELPKKVRWKHRLVTALLFMHCGTQIFLPYSHFITKGYNNWTNGLYGYSWDMMVHSWDTVLVSIKVVNNDSGEEFFLHPRAWTFNQRWNKHADMCLQYAECAKRNLLASAEKDKSPPNLSLYVDVWCSLNKRFQQRMYDVNYDLLKARWSPFEPVEWLKPVLTEYNNLRSRMNEISENVYSWSNTSDVMFIADFPGLYLENFISTDLDNVSLTLLEGEIIYEVENEHTQQSVGVKLTSGENIPVEIGIFHKIHTVSSTPSCYMYTFSRKGKIEDAELKPQMYSPFPLLENGWESFGEFKRMWSHIYSSLIHVLFGGKLDTKRKKILGDL